MEGDPTFLRGDEEEAKDVVRGSFMEEEREAVGVYGVNSNEEEGERKEVCLGVSKSLRESSLVKEEAALSGVNIIVAYVRKMFVKKKKLSLSHWSPVCNVCNMYCHIDTRTGTGAQ